MKKLLLSLIIALTALTVPAQSPVFQSRKFILSSVASINVTNATGLLTPLGGWTNVLSWGYPGIQATNAAVSTWSNVPAFPGTIGAWVIPTNASGNALLTVSNISFVTNDSTILTQDIPLWTDREGRLPITVLTNGAVILSTLVNQAFLSPMTVSCKFWGAAGFASSGALTLIFVGVPDGTNEWSTTAGSGTPKFEWVITPTVGRNVVVTNFPIWHFAGMKAVRLRSITDTVTAAVNVNCSVEDVSLNGFVP